MAAYLGTFTLINVIWLSWIWYTTRHSRTLLQNVRELERVRRAAGRAIVDACGQAYKMTSDTDSYRQHENKVDAPGTDGHVKTDSDTDTRQKGVSTCGAEQYLVDEGGQNNGQNNGQMSSIPLAARAEDDDDDDGQNNGQNNGQNIGQRSLHIEGGVPSEKDTETKQDQEHERTSVYAHALVSQPRASHYVSAAYTDYASTSLTHVDGPYASFQRRVTNVDSICTLAQETIVRKVLEKYGNRRLLYLAGKTPDALHSLLEHVCSGARSHARKEKQRKSASAAATKWKDRAAAVITEMY